MKARINGKIYELPTLTMPVNEKMEEYDDVEDQFKQGKIKASDVYRAEYDILKFLLGEESTCEILHGDNIDEIDLTNLTLALMDVRRAYAQPIIDKQLDEVKSTIGSVRSEIELVDKVKNV